MTASTIRKKFLDYFSKHEHVVVSSSSLIPDNDPTVLFTTAGMQQFKPYFLGERNPDTILHARRAVSIQKCFRTTDIDAIGDDSHHTFFEMLGNFSFGDYSKEGAITLAWEFLTKTLKLPVAKLWATIFSGDDRSVKDFEAFKLWQTYLPTSRINELGRADNWWGPPGTSGPCGPCSEIHYDVSGKPCNRGPRCLPGCSCGRFVEIWNLVFMEYFQDESGGLRPLPQKNVDTGMGFERLVRVLEKKDSMYETDIFATIVKTIEHEPGFGGTGTSEERTRRVRIIADHLRGSVFLVADGVRFLNKEQGYVLRRIFRRALDQFTHPLTSYDKVIDGIIDGYQVWYPYLKEQRATIHEVLRAEAAAYDETVQRALQKITSVLKRRTSSTEASVSTTLSADETFELYSTFGLSLDRLRQEGYRFDDQEVRQRIERHRQTSRAGAVGKFGGHGLGYALDPARYQADDIAKVTRLHTATHLLHQALRSILGQHVQQSGSDITPARLRFDFTHPTKVTPEQLTAIEKLVNEQIRRDLPVANQEMPLPEALQSGALSFFREKYPERVKVYQIGDFSREICGGPHVSHTAEIGEFRIASEKSSSAGIRRIKAEVSAPKP